MHQSTTCTPPRGQGTVLDTVKARKLAYYGHTMKKQGSCLEKEIMQGTMPGARRRGRPRTAWMDNIKTWTGLSVEESIRMTEDRDKWRKYVHGVANPGPRTAKDQTRGGRCWGGELSGPVDGSMRQRCRAAWSLWTVCVM